MNGYTFGIYFEDDQMTFSFSMKVSSSAFILTAMVTTTNKITEKKFILKFRTSCNEILGNCTWNGKPFECCDAFLPLKTEFGLCFSTNSMHTR